MNKILIICYGYDGKNSNNPNSICLYGVVENLSKLNEVTIITTTTREKVYKKNEGKLNIFYVPINSKKNGKLNFKDWGIEVIKFIKDEMDIKTISKLFTISFPFNVQKIALNIKKFYPHLEWIVYELDPYAYNLILRYPKLLFIFRYFQERKIFNTADYILLTHELFTQYSNNFYKKYKLKFRDIGIPLMEIHDNDEMQLEKTNINCKLMYIGSFYNKVREPKYMFEVLSEVFNFNTSLEIHLYGPSNESVPAQYKEKFGEKLIIHGRVSKEEVISAINEADFLINIGNSINNQLPSKVLEYIGTGKPIINFYSIQDDTSNRYLNNYPNALLIDQNNEHIQENTQKIVEFIHKVRNTKIPKYKIEEIYTDDTILAVEKKILNVLNQNIKH